MKQTPTRGGTRKGAGRPRGRVTRTVPATFNILPETKAEIRRQSRALGTTQSQILDQTFTPSKI